MKLYHDSLTWDVLQWLENHGYTHYTGSSFKIHISLPNVEPDDRVPNFQQIITADQIYGMTIAELELLDQNIWLKARQELVKVMEKQTDLRKDGGSFKWKKR